MKYLGYGVFCPISRISLVSRVFLSYSKYRIAMQFYMYRRLTACGGMIDGMLIRHQSKTLKAQQ
jgi:hypothetical protein